MTDPMPAAPAEPPPRPDRDGPANSRGEVRVSTITGDRVCTRCAFNLCGQPIVREPHYSMLMVRCPECGTPAALNEYPMLGRWANRWGLLLAAGWFAALMLGALMTGAMLIGLTGVASERLLEPLAIRIAEKHKAHWERVVEQEAEAGPPVSATAATTATNSWVITNAVSQPAGTYSYIDAAWWKGHDARTIVSEMGGVWKAVRLASTGTLLPSCLFPLLAGMMWAVALMHLRRPRLILMSLPLIVVAGLWAWWIRSEQATAWWGGTASQFAAEHLGGWVATACIAALSVFLIAGMMIGRPVIRLLIRMYLPPRLRGALGSLWIADGLTPPSTPPSTAPSTRPPTSPR